MFNNVRDRRKIQGSYLILPIKKDDQSVRLKVWNGEIKSDGLTVKLYK